MKSKFCSKRKIAYTIKGFEYQGQWIPPKTILRFSRLPRELHNKVRIIKCPQNPVHCENSTLKFNATGTSLYYFCDKAVTPCKFEDGR